MAFNINPPKALVPESFDAVTDCTYDANNNMLSCKFRQKDASGPIISTLTCTYDANNNMISAVRS